MASAIRDPYVRASVRPSFPGDDFPKTRQPNIHLPGKLAMDRANLAAKNPVQLSFTTHSTSNGRDCDCEEEWCILNCRQQWFIKRGDRTSCAGWYDQDGEEVRIGNTRPDYIRWWGVFHHDKEVARYNSGDYEDHVGFTGETHSGILIECEEAMCQSLNVHVEILRPANAAAEAIAAELFSSITFDSLQTMERDRWNRLDRATQSHLRTCLKNGRECPIHHESAIHDCRGPECWKNRWAVRFLSRRSARDVQMKELQDIWEMLGESERSIAKFNKQVMVAEVHLDVDRNQHFSSLLDCKETQCQGNKWHIEFLTRRDAVELVRKNENGVPRVASGVQPTRSYQDDRRIDLLSLPSTVRGSRESNLPSTLTERELSLSPSLPLANNIPARQTYPAQTVPGSSRRSLTGNGRSPFPVDFQQPPQQLPPSSKEVRQPLWEIGIEHVRSEGNRRPSPLQGVHEPSSKRPRQSDGREDRTDLTDC
ncbi:hypothetical protein BLS_003557 [Venturia inaequalis]|uniref:Uncharacterized protein n=1 Tax=Venturia inaequalis TaxID=5025 RepID=A0A8H3YXQ7_VENIN|nr:hypothetical protein BLS_003557 [Venturia inaequalis]KAE9989135.1 hypothetical protein EG328_000067 [Venturia inaequalis]KAE9989735.1 hypothetical protein EG327_002330 [Venturia inaequalis]